jgi:DnaK suppressor protein
MTKSVARKYRSRLQRMLDQAGESESSLGDEMSHSPAGMEGGNLSAAPIHLGDLSSDVSAQEVNAALRENQGAIRAAVADALKRIDEGNFGRCERCGKNISQKRLDALPYARFCLNCAASQGQPPMVEQQAQLSAEPPNAPTRRRRQFSVDRHASGTPGGGTEVGGLAGTNVGRGDPQDLDLEDTPARDKDRRPTDEEIVKNAYAGASGGAVGGTPANKRASGGRRKR